MLATVTDVSPGADAFTAIWTFDTPIVSVSNVDGLTVEGDVPVSFSQLNSTQLSITYGADDVLSGAEFEVTASLNTITFSGGKTLNDQIGIVS